jgi:hypothetical protein
MQIKKSKNEKKLQQEKLEKLTRKESLINKETMTSPFEVGISSYIEVQMMENSIINKEI